MIKYLKIDSFIFFDGEKSFQINDGIYNDYFTSVDYEEYSKSYVEFNNKKIMLFDYKSILSLTTFSDFTKTELEDLAILFDLELKEYQPNDYELTKKGHYGNFKKVENNDFTLIFELGGGRAIEEIYIHGLWKKIDL